MMNERDTRAETAAAERPQTERGEIRAETARQTAGNDETFLPQDRLDDLRARWNDVQAQFVDDPREAVSRAQALVGSVVDDLTQTFQRQRGALEGQWTSGGNVDTEMLRVTLQRYRDFFNRLLATSE
jgi:hypothetical protein